MFNSDVVFLIANVAIFWDAANYLPRADVLG
jgi:hypothetical protein